MMKGAALRQRAEHWHTSEDEAQRWSEKGVPSVFCLLSPVF